MYYGLILISVVMFGGCFALNDVYRRMRGSSLRISLQFSLISALSCVVILLAANGFRLEFTWFTLVMALLTSLVGMGFTFCAFKALDTINLSLYSLFSMLGGMVLPFLQGIVFYGEEVTVAKVVCLVLITAALCVTVERGEKRRGTPYYIGIFVLNGLSGMLSKLFTSAPFEKTSATGYSIWIAVCTAVLSAVLLPFFQKDERETPIGLASTGVAVLGGGINRVANLLLVIALAHVDASVQYPMVTGGVMIVSTCICFFKKNKPKKKELCSVLLAFLGMLALFVLQKL